MVQDDVHFLFPGHLINRCTDSAASFQELLKVVSTRSNCFTVYKALGLFVFRTLYGKDVLKTGPSDGANQVRVLNNYIKNRQKPKDIQRPSTRKTQKRVGDWVGGVPWNFQIQGFNGSGPLKR